MWRSWESPSVDVRIHPAPLSGGFWWFSPSPAGLGDGCVLAVGAVADPIPLQESGSRVMKRELSRGISLPGASGREISDLLQYSPCAVSPVSGWLLCSPLYLSARLLSGVDLSAVSSDTGCIAVMIPGLPLSPSSPSREAPAPRCGDPHTSPRACVCVDGRLTPMGPHNFLIYCLSAFITLFFKLKLPPDGVSDTDLLICNKTSLITCAAAHSSSSEGGIISLWMSQE